MLTQASLCSRENAVDLGANLVQVGLQRLHVLELALCLRLLDETLEEGLLLQERLERLRDLRVWIDRRGRSFRRF